MRPSRYLPHALLAALFLLPRLLFLAWLMHGSALYKNCDCSAREISGCGEGGWIESARLLTEGRPTPPNDDQGMPVLIAAAHAGGLPFTAAYWFVIAALHLGALALLLMLYHRLAMGEMGRWQALAAVGALVLYPPGWYYSSCNIMRIVPVYAFLAAMTIYLYRDDFLSGLRGRNIAALAAASLALVVLGFVRSSNRALAFALIIALTINVARTRRGRAALAAFVFLYAGWSAALRPFFPRSQHVFWHPVYIYLSDFDNKYGIQHADDYAHSEAMKVNAALTLQNVEVDPSYEPTLKKLYMDKVTGDPVWFARILALRCVKLSAFPFQGSWLPPLSRIQEEMQVRMGDLSSSMRLAAYRLYITLDTLSIVIDIGLTLLGAIGLFLFFRSGSWPAALEFGVLLGSVLYVYVLIGTPNRTVYLAGTYVYFFFAIRILSRAVSGLFPRLVGRADAGR